MASQKSTAAQSHALEPTRRRGKDRVAAILRAAALLFTEKGYDATTMTEIAARSGTAIGSLYRFFPTKAVLADTLLARYAGLLAENLDAIAGRVAADAPEATADALVDMMLDLRIDRGAAVALLDTAGDNVERRAQLRGAMRSGLAAILGAGSPRLSPAEARDMATILLHSLKGIPGLADQPGGAALVAEMRALVRLYVARAFAGKS